MIKENRQLLADEPVEVSALGAVSVSSTSVTFTPSNSKIVYWCSQSPTDVAAVSSTVVHSAKGWLVANCLYLEPNHMQMPKSPGQTTTRL